ncbi:hypothetical protein F5Y13DRAFT_75829 [Hypoxylon sp. FL1857]|nr:hypothetical protein F5Y13DRAFT_75829 [Hypoxylon sp. FL1857]
MFITVMRTVSGQDGCAGSATCSSRESTRATEPRCDPYFVCTADLSNHTSSCSCVFLVTSLVSSFFFLHVNLVISFTRSQSCVLGSLSALPPALDPSSIALVLPTYCMQRTADALSVDDIRYPVCRVLLRSRPCIYFLFYGTETEHQMYLSFDDTRSSNVRYLAKIKRAGPTREGFHTIYDVRHGQSLPSCVTQMSSSRQ